jgi:hypothetical protein
MDPPTIQQAFAADGLSMWVGCVWLRSWLALLATIVLPSPVWHAGEVGGAPVAATAETQNVGWLGMIFEWVLPCCPEALHLSGPLATGNHEVLLAGALIGKRRGSVSGVGSLCWIRLLGCGPRVG